MYEETLTVGIIGMVFIVILTIILLSLIPTIFYLLTLQKAFNRCQPSNRAMEPGLVWLQLIPLFNIVWHFFIVINLSDSLEREFAQRGLPTEPAPGKSLGLAMCILNVCTIIPYLAALAGLAGLICWIVYWVKIADYSSRLANSTPSSMAGIPSAG